MSNPRTQLIESIVTDFTSRHIRSPQVFLPRRKADRKRLIDLKIPSVNPATAPDVIIHDQERNFLFLFDAVNSRRQMDEGRRKYLMAQFAPCGLGLIFFSAFAHLDAFSRFAESIAWETVVWIADAPDHMIHYNGVRFLGPYPA